MSLPRFRDISPKGPQMANWERGGGFNGHIEFGSQALQRYLSFVRQMVDQMHFVSEQYVPLLKCRKTVPPDLW